MKHLLVCLLVIGLTACGSSSTPVGQVTQVVAEASPTLVSTNTPTSSPTPTATPTSSPTPTATSIPTITPTPTIAEIMAVTATPEQLVPVPVLQSDPAADRYQGLIDILRADGMTVSADDIAIEGDVARVIREDANGIVFLFYRWQQGTWVWFASGTMFDPESAARQGIPEALLP